MATTTDKTISQVRSSLSFESAKSAILAQNKSNIPCDPSFFAQNKRDLLQINTSL